MSKTVVGLIDGENHVQDAINDLLKAGFDRKDIGVVAPDVRTESEKALATARKGLALGAGTAALLGAIAIAIPGIGPAVVTGPLLAVPVLGSLLGGLVGALSASGVPEQEAHFYAEGVRRGGALVTVRVRDDEQAARAAQILKDNCAADVAQRAAEWAREGWNRRFHGSQEHQPMEARHS